MNIPTAKGSRLSQAQDLELGSNQVEAEFGVRNKGHMRQELEVELHTMNNRKFVGSITPQEAKFIIYRDTLGFSDFSIIFLNCNFLLWNNKAF